MPGLGSITFKSANKQSVWIIGGRRSPNLQGQTFNRNRSHWPNLKLEANMRLANSPILVRNVCETNERNEEQHDSL